MGCSYLDIEWFIQKHLLDHENLLEQEKFSLNITFGKTYLPYIYIYTQTIFLIVYIGKTWRTYFLSTLN